MDLMLHAGGKVYHREVVEYTGLIKRLLDREYIPNRNSVLNLRNFLRVHGGVHEGVHGGAHEDVNPERESLY
jgi:hypothetical protein